jgi:uncharacterized protein YjbI with pentapeptide repeats
MANQDHLKILKQGVEVWNRWRMEDFYLTPDLSDTDLKESMVAHWWYANLSGANLSGANLSGMDIRRADLHEANLSRANLSRSTVSHSNLSRANLGGANLNTLELVNTNLSGTDLRNTDFTGAEIGWTIFTNNDLSATRGLEAVEHVGPSSIGVDTFSKSGGQVPAAFLRGCGLSDWQIEDAKLYNPNLSNEEINNIQYRIHDLRVWQAIQISRYSFLTAMPMAYL